MGAGVVLPDRVPCDRGVIGASSPDDLQRICLGAAAPGIPNQLLGLFWRRGASPLFIVQVEELFASSGIRTCKQKHYIDIFSDPEKRAGVKSNRRSFRGGRASRAKIH